MDSELFWDDEGSSKLPGSKIESAIGDGAKGVSAVSDDGATILIADEYVVSRRRSGDNSDVSFDVARRPVSLSPESTGPGTVLTADGYLRHADGSEERLAFPGIGATDAVELAAAEPDGNGGFTMVTVDGRLFSATSENGVRHLGEIGGGNASFALRVSPHTSQLAVIGEQGLVVFDTAAKRTIFREPAHGQAVLTDVAFADDNATLFAVNQIGAVRSIDISGDASGDARLVNPRELTADESTLFNVQGG